MRFTVFGREVDVKWDHIFCVMGAEIGIAIIISLIVLLFSFAIGSLSGADTVSLFVGYLDIASVIIGPIMLPLTAFSFLYVAERFFRMGKDDSLFSSLSASYFILWGVGGVALGLVTMLIYMSQGQFGIIGQAATGLINILLNYSFSSIIIYLWMLVFARIDNERIGNTAGLALIFAVGSFLFSELIGFVVAYSNDMVYSFGYDLFEGFITLASLFVLGFVILYHLYKRKITNETYLIALLFVSPTIFFIIVNLFLGVTSGDASGAFYLGNVGNGIIYLLGRAFELGILFILYRTRLR